LSCWTASGRAPACPAEAAVWPVQVLPVDVNDKQPCLVARQENEEPVPVELLGRQQVLRLLRRYLGPPLERWHFPVLALTRVELDMARYEAGAE